MKSTFKRQALLFSLLAFSLSATAQEPLVKDLDGDNRPDSVYLDVEKTVIVCRLSSQHFRKIQSRPMENMSLIASGVKATKNGFSFSHQFMRAGYAAQFRYQPSTRKMQLIGMSREEFGNAANDGSGESSVNLLTGDYLGNWNYFDYKANNGEGDLIKVPTIQTKMVLRPTTLETFSEVTYEDYATRCAKLYEQARNRMQQSRKRK